MSLGSGGLSLEQPSYTVLEKCHGYEVRRYEASILAVASAEVDANQPDQKDSALFSTLAGYIGVRGTAMNAQGRPIKMTAPVLTWMEDDTPLLPTKRKSMAFVLPRSFESVEQAPRPTNPRVRIMKLPSRTVAVNRFSGMASMSDSRRRADMVMSSLKLKGHAPINGAETGGKRGLGMILDAESMRVISVVPGSLAARAGIRAGDQIREANSVSVASPQQLASAVRNVPGDSVIMLKRHEPTEEHYVVLEGAGDAEPAQNTAPLARSMWTLARYDPPFVPASVRTNEVMIALDTGAEHAGESHATRTEAGKASRPADADAYDHLRDKHPGDLHGDAGARICTLIRAALKTGVPMYNGGDAEGCAQVYQKCCEEMLQVEDMDEGVREEARQVLHGDEEAHQRSAGSRAWALRRVLDRALAKQQAQQQMQQQMDSGHHNLVDLGRNRPSSSDGGWHEEGIPPSKSARPVFYMDIARNLSSGEVMSLHMFEARYKELVQEALASADRSFIFTRQRPQAGQEGWMIEILSASVEDSGGSADIKCRVRAPVRLTHVSVRDTSQSSEDDTLFWADCI